MSINVNVESEFVSTKGKIAQQPQKVQEEQASMQVEQNQLSGVQWMQTQNPQSVQAASQANQGQAASLNQSKSGKSDISAPTFEDIVVFSSIDTSGKTTSVRPKINLSRFGMNWSAMEESYRETFKRSKSHNFLLERFMANVKFNGIKMLFSLVGISAEEQDKIQNEVREEALAEIESKLSQEWAYAKAMLEIIG